MYSDFDGLGLPGRVLREGGNEPELSVWDALGNLEEHRLPIGGAGNDPTQPTKYRRDGLHRVDRMTDAGGRNTTYTYTLDGQRERVHPPAGADTVVVFDRRGFPQSGTDPDNPGGWSQIVDANGNVTRYTNPRSGVTNSVYDALDRMIQSDAPDVTTTNEYDLKVAGFFTSETTVGTRKTTTEFDARGRVKRSTANDNITVTENFYDEQDQLVASQAKFNSVVQTCTVNGRDARDRVHSVTVRPESYPGSGTGITTFTIYNKAGSVIREVDPLGSVSNTSLAAPHKTAYVRDPRERVEQVIDGKGVTIREYRYGDDDLVSEVLWPDPASEGVGLVTLERRTYTALKELKSSKNAAGKGVDVEYGVLPGQVKKTRDARTVENTVDHDSDTQRPKTVTRAANAGGLNGGASETRLEWENGLPKSTTVWNPASNSYSSVYGTTFDESYRQTGATAPLQAPTSLVYNPTKGDLDEVTSIGATGSRNVVHQRDSLGRAFRSDWSGVAGGFQTRAFNGLSLVEATQDGNGRREMIWDTYRMAPRDETLIRSGVMSKMQHHEIDNAGNAVFFTDTANKTHATPVDENNKVTQLAYDNGTLCSYTYTPGQLVKTSTIRGAGGAVIATTTKYRDSLGRESRSVTVNGQGKIVSDYRRTFTDRDEIETEILGHLGVTVQYTYTPRGELERQVIIGNLGGQACPPFENEFVPDTGGAESVPSSEVQGATSTVLAVPNLDAEYIYDQAGNRVSMIVDGQTTTFAYNSASQLVSESWPSNKTVTHAYDDWGNEELRTTVEDLGGGQTRTTEEHYGYNYLNTLDLYMKFVDASLVSHFEYGVWDDGFRASKRNVLTGKVEYFMPRMGQSITEYVSEGGVSPILKDTHVAMGLDAVKTRIAAAGDRAHFLTDGVGTLGVCLADSGAVQDTVVRRGFGELHAGSTVERISGGLTGAQLDDETGLTYLRNRYLDPKTGRFTQRDPIGIDYVYCANNPVQNIDPGGDRWKVKPGPGAETMMRDLMIYTGLVTEIDEDGYVWFKEPWGGQQYGSKDDLKWIMSVQNDSTETDIAGLWIHLVNGDAWHRERFAKAWTETFNAYSPVTEAFKQGNTWGIYQAPEEYQDDPAFIAGIWSWRVAQVALAIATAGASIKGSAAVAGAAGATKVGGVNAAIAGAADLKALAATATSVTTATTVVIGSNPGATARFSMAFQQNISRLSELSIRLSQSPQVVTTAPRTIQGAQAAHKFAGMRISDILRTKFGSIKDAELPEGSPNWNNIMNIRWEEVVRRAQGNETGWGTIKKLLTDKRWDRKR
jgi:RHS repeat-associated protein